MIDHDRLFKELLQNFFVEFIELFLPDVAAYLERGSLEFLDKEVFTDVTAGERHEADLVVKCRFRGHDAFFLVHVENQSTAQPAFAARMFRYFARLHEKYDLPVYPIAVFSYDTPQRVEPDRYQVEFPDRRVLDFSFAVVQLNRLNWRDFVRQPNPLASALMAKMQVAPEDRPRVKLECLRLLATLQLNPAKMHLIAGFVATYLKLDAAGQRVFELEVESMPPSERETYFDFDTPGVRRGKADVLLRQLARRFGPPPEGAREQLECRDVDQLNQLADDIFNFTSMADFEAWLDHHPQN